MFGLVVRVVEMGNNGSERANGGSRLHALAKRALFGIDRLGGKVTEQIFCHVSQLLDLGLRIIFYKDCDIVAVLPSP